MDRDLAFIAALHGLDVFELLRREQASPWGWGPLRSGAVSAAKYGRKYQRKIRVRKT